MQRTGTDVQYREEDWKWRPKFPSMGGHLGFTFCPSKWLGVSIPDMKIEFIVGGLSVVIEAFWTWCVFPVRATFHAMGEGENCFITIGILTFDYIHLQTVALPNVSSSVHLVRFSYAIVRFDACNEFIRIVGTCCLISKLVLSRDCALYVSHRI